MTKKMHFWDIRGSSCFKAQSYFKLDWEGTAEDILREVSLTEYDKLWIVFRGAWIEPDVKNRFIFNLTQGKPPKLPLPREMPYEVAIIFDWANSNVNPDDDFETQMGQYYRNLKTAVEELLKYV